MQSEMTLKAVASYTVKVGFSSLKHPFPVSLFRTCLCADAAKKKINKYRCNQEHVDILLQSFLKMTILDGLLFRRWDFFNSHSAIHL